MGSTRHLGGISLSDMFIFSSPYVSVTLTVLELACSLADVPGGFELMFGFTENGCWCGVHTAVLPGQELWLALP